MKFKIFACLTFVLVADLLIPRSNAGGDGKFRLSSTTFANKNDASYEYDRQHR